MKRRMKLTGYKRDLLVGAGSMSLVVIMGLTLTPTSFDKYSGTSVTRGEETSQNHQMQPSISGESRALNSVGEKINQAANEMPGLEISENMRSQIKGLDNKAPLDNAPEIISSAQQPSQDIGINSALQVRVVDENLAEMKVAEIKIPEIRTTETTGDFNRFPIASDESRVTILAEIEVHQSLVANDLPSQLAKSALAEANRTPLSNVIDTLK